LIFSLSEGLSRFLALAAVFLRGQASTEEAKLGAGAYFT
jgi:hypothetical protein